MMMVVHIIQFSSWFFVCVGGATIKVKNVKNTSLWSVSSFLFFEIKKNKTHNRVKCIREVRLVV